MSTLLLPEQVRHVVATDLPDAALGDIIADEEARLIERCGPHGDGVTAATAIVPGGLGGSLFLPRKAVSVTSIQERSLGGTYATVTSTGYTLWPGAGVIERHSGGWSGQVLITYIPADDRSKRRRILIELVRVALEQTAYTQQGIAGESSITAPNWEAKRAALYRQVGFMTL